MSIEIDARDVLKYLNELGYYDISTRQLKEFIRDLKTLIKYEHKKKSRRENVENIQPISSDSCYYAFQQNRSELTQSDLKCNSNTENAATQTKRNENYLSEIFNTLYSTSTVSSRAKSCSKKQSDQNIISVDIIKSKPSKPLYSSSATSDTTNNEVHVRPTSSLSRTKFTINNSDTVSDLPQFTTSTGRRTKSTDTFDPEFRPTVSFIRPRKPVKVSKSDPVTLYQQYQEEWKKQKLPGENKRYELRWHIRERMLGEPDVLPRTSTERFSKKSSRI